MSLKIYYANGLVFEMPQWAVWLLIALSCTVILSALWATTVATVGPIHLSTMEEGYESDEESDYGQVIVRPGKRGPCVV
jgi:hypothetical protein